MKKFLFVFGTRPEAIKMIPLIDKLSNNGYVVKVCTTDQHVDMLNQVLNLFQIEPDFRLNVMKTNQSLSDIFVEIMNGLKNIFLSEKFDMVFVHGDTATTLAGALSAFYHQIPVSHIEAGLRTYDLKNPYPEELNRQLVSRIATLHFAPTKQGLNNLYSEGINKNVWITGNTVIDALYMTLEKLILPNEKIIKRNLLDKYPNLYCAINSRYILTTIHRRESFGRDLLNIFQALKRIALKYPKTYIVYPVHLNPNVKNIAYEVLDGIQNVILLPPLNYLDFLFIMKDAYLVVTDSGGIQEEAPSLGIPVLVVRNVTERPEAIDAGTVKLVGTNTENICESISAFLENEKLHNEMSQKINPYGDGKASQRILDCLLKYYSVYE